MYGWSYIAYIQYMCSDPQLLAPNSRPRSGTTWCAREPGTTPSSGS